MKNRVIPQERAYQRHLRSTAEWLLRSERPTGGSAAHWSHLLGWSRAYPETTGYVIPTLLRLGHFLQTSEFRPAAYRFGEWLLEIQNPDGSWSGGLHPPAKPRPSVFNTGQILKGLMALYRDSSEEHWLEPAKCGLRWLVQGLAAEGLWSGRDYRSDRTPSYYTHVLWPMLDVAVAVGDDQAIEGVHRSVSRIEERVRPNGAIDAWGFSDDEPAFTHTIAYTLRGIQEIGRILQDGSIVDLATPALEKLVRLAELRGGHLPGAFDQDWHPAGSFVCLTGNCQVALSVLLLEERDPDLRLVSASARMLDVVCRTQRRSGPRKGGVAGSLPLWGPYMRFRYPNWAAKYLCDALMALLTRVQRIDE